MFTIYVAYLIISCACIAQQSFTISVSAILLLRGYYAETYETGVCLETGSRAKKPSARQPTDQLAGRTSTLVAGAFVVDEM